MHDKRRASELSHQFFDFRDPGAHLTVVVLSYAYGVPSKRVNNDEIRKEFTPTKRSRATRRRSRERWRGTSRQSQSRQLVVDGRALTNLPSTNSRRQFAESCSNRAIWVTAKGRSTNAMHDRRSALIVRCTGTADMSGLEEHRYGPRRIADGSACGTLNRATIVCHITLTTAGGTQLPSMTDFSGQ